MADFLDVISMKVAQQNLKIENLFDCNFVKKNLWIGIIISADL